MTAKNERAVERTPAAVIDKPVIDEQWQNVDSGQFEALVGTREDPLLVWCGGFMCVLLVVGALAVTANSQGWLSLGLRPPAFAAELLTEFSPALADRTSCAEMGSSDLRSPPEGVWYQANCVPAFALPLIAPITSCNRTSLDLAEFTEVSPGLYVFRQAGATSAYLWFASSGGCFDLVSTRVVSAVCADQTVSFSWSKRACSSHGGVLTWVNGR